jgi:hypothetical protein
MIGVEICGSKKAQSSLHPKAEESIIHYEESIFSFSFHIPIEII